MTFFRGILVFLGSLMFSVLLWGYVRLSAVYEAPADLPVQLTPPKGYALVSGLPERLHAQVRGAGWQILLMDFAKNASFQFDLSLRATPPPSVSGGPAAPLVISGDEITHAAFLPSELRILKVEPDSLKLLFSSDVQKPLPVASRLQVTAAPGYVIVGDPVVRPRMVLASGASSVLDALASIPTASETVTDTREDVDRILPLSDSLGNFITVPSAPKISIHVEVQALGERTFPGIPVTIDALPPLSEVLLIPSTVTVTVRGGVDVLAHLQPSAVHAHVLYDPLVFDTAKTILPKIETPRGVTYLMEDPRFVRFIVRRRENSLPNTATLQGGLHATP